MPERLVDQPSVTSFEAERSSDSHFVREAYNFAKEAHGEQLRNSGEPYFEGHCVPVANTIKGWGVEDEEILAAALLHDVLEDTDVSFIELEGRFGTRVARIVDGVSKLRSVVGEVNAERLTHQKVLEAQYLEPGVALVKLADRVHNMATLDAMSPEKQVEKAEETLDVYVPLAEALGMWEVKTWLEDQAYRYADYEEYLKVKREIDYDPRLDKQFVENRVSRIKNLLSGMEGTVDARRGGYYALSQKRDALFQNLESDGSGFSDINDVLSIRVQVESFEECYLFLGKLQKAMRLNKNDTALGYPDDYIGNPQPNGYQAYQITIQTERGPIEVAIMTREMESFNRWGVVDVIRTGRNIEEIQEFRLKSALISDGNGGPNTLRFLPPGATVLDAAYTLGPVAGLQMNGAMVNGEFVGPSYSVPNGALVQFTYDSTISVPPSEAINYVLPSTARMIERQKRAVELRKVIEAGKERVQGVLEERGIVDLQDLGEERLVTILLPFENISTLEQLYYSVVKTPKLLGHLKEVLDNHGVTKEDLKWSTLVASGDDQPRIFEALSAKIGENGGNIVTLNMEKEDEKYTLRIVFEDIESGNIPRLQDELSGLFSFDMFRIV